MVAEYHSNGLDKTTRGRGVTVIFGDGAGACVFSREEDTTKGILSTHLHSEGKYADKLIVASPSIKHWVPEIIRSRMMKIFLIIHIWMAPLFLNMPL